MFGLWFLAVAVCALLVWWARRRLVYERAVRHQEGSVVLTGASSGIGLNAARLLASRGFHVFASVRTGADASRLADMDLPTLHPVVCDVTDFASLVQQRERIARDIEENGWPSIIALVSNAGICNWLPLEMAVAEGICRDELEVNMIGHMNFLSAFVPIIRSNKCRLVYVSSGAAVEPLPDRFRYSASKIAGEYITRGLAAELGVKSFILRPKLTNNTLMLRKDIDKAKGWMAKYHYMSGDHEGWWRTFSRLIERYKTKDVTTMGVDIGLVSAKILDCISLQNPPAFVPFYKITWSQRMQRVKEALFDSF